MLIVYYLFNKIGMSPRKEVPLLCYMCIKIVAFQLIYALSDDLSENYEIVCRYISGATYRVLQDLLEFILNDENLEAATRFSCLKVLQRDDVRKLDTGVFPHSYYVKIFDVLILKGKGLQYLNLKGIWARDEPEKLSKLLLELKNLRVLLMPHIANDLVIKSVQTCDNLRVLDIAGDCNFSFGGLCELQSYSITVLDIGSYGVKDICQGTNRTDVVVASLIESLPNLLILKTYSFVGAALLLIYSKKANFKTKLAYLHDTHTTVQVISAIIKLCPKLESIYLDSPEDTVLNYLSELKYLSILKVSKPNNAELMNFLGKSGTPLQVLKVIRSRVKALDLSQICLLAPNLITLECFKVDLTVSNLDNYFMNLETFEVFYCNSSNSIVNYVLSHSPFIKRFIIGDVITMTDGDIFRLCAESEFLNLAEIWFSCAKRLTPMSVELLMAHCPNLKYLGQLSGWDCTTDDIDYLRAVIVSTNTDLTLLPLSFLPEVDIDENIM